MAQRRGRTYDARLRSSSWFLGLQLILVPVIKNGAGTPRPRGFVLRAGARHGEEDTGDRQKMSSPWYW